MQLTQISQKHTFYHRFFPHHQVFARNSISPETTLLKSACQQDHDPRSLSYIDWRHEERPHGETHPPPCESQASRYLDLGLELRGGGGASLNQPISCQYCSFRSLLQINGFQAIPSSMIPPGFFPVCFHAIYHSAFGAGIVYDDYSTCYRF